MELQKVFTWAKRSFGGANGNAALSFRLWTDGRAVRNTHYADQDDQERPKRKIINLENFELPLGSFGQHEGQLFSS